MNEQKTPSLFIKTIEHTAQFFRTHKTYSALLLVSVVAVVTLGIISTPKVTDDMYVVKPGDLNQTIAVSGSVEASKEAKLSFQTTGQVSFVGVRIGDNVPQGKVLAALEAGNAQASLLEAEALLANKSATLEQLRQGARKEELAVKEQFVENAKDSLLQAYNNLPDAIKNTDAVTSDTIKNKLSSLFIFNGGQYVLSFSSCDQRSQGIIEIKRTEMENILADFQKKSTVISTISSEASIDEAFSSAYNAAILTNELVNLISQLLLSSCSSSNTSLDAYRVTLSSVKTNITTLFSDLATKRSALTTAKNNFNQAKRDLELAKAGTDPYTLKAQTALVSQAEASVASARANLAKTYVVAPFSGVITSGDLSVGETVTSGSPVFNMIATDGFEIEAKVPEIDITKVNVGARVDVTLDAYGNSVVFPATVTRINPTATTEGTVPVYKVIVTFVGKDTRIRQGMTANVKIITESKTNIIAVPSRYINFFDDRKGQAVISSDGKETLREVSLGVRGDGGLVEVTSGLFEGDVLVSPKTIVRQAQKQNN